VLPSSKSSPTAAARVFTIDRAFNIKTSIVFGKPAMPPKAITNQVGTNLTVMLVFRDGF